jgi:hypothetical protein
MYNHKGKNNSNYKDGRTLKKYYCYCGKELSDYRKHFCKECRYKEHSKRMKNRKFSKEHRKNMSLAQKGRIITDKHKQKISLAKGGTGIIYKNKNDYFKNQRKIDINFKIREYLRSRIWHALKGKNKSESTMKLLGCHIDLLRLYLQSKFQPGMSFSNYGKWHIDHIIPCARFDLSKPEEQKICFNYKNLQPLWAEENLKKGSK